MFVIILAALMGLSVTAPTHAATFGDLVQTLGTVTVFTEPNFAGAETAVDAFRKCSQTFGARAIKSLKQQQGSVCHYYQSPGCTISNHVPVLRHDSTAAEWDAADLGEWAGKIESINCDLVAP